MKTISEMWEPWYSKLSRYPIDPKYPEKNEVVRHSMRPSKYGEQAERIINVTGLNDQDSILEIGCGYGGLAQEILKERQVSYIVVDNEIMLNQARKFLGDKVEYIEAKEIETLQDKRFKLFISNSCLNETPLEYKMYVLKNIIGNCQKIFITALTNDKLIEDYIRKYFKAKKTKSSKNQSIYVGESKF